MLSIKSIVEENTTVAGRLFDLVCQCLIVISLISFSVETLPNLTLETRRLLRYVEIGTIAVFTLEYVLRIVVAVNPGRSSIRSSALCGFEAAKSSIE